MLLAQLLTLSAFIVGGIVFYAEAKRRKLATTGIGKITIAALIGGLAGAKITELIFGGGPSLTESPWTLFDPTTGGRTIVGGIVGGWIAVEIAKRVLGIRRTTGDMFALALPAGEAVGRLGCFVGGCCYGIESSVPWSVYQHGAFRHPTQLYLAAAAAITFLVLTSLRKRTREGSLFPLYLMMFGSYRLVIEFFRVREIAFSGLSVAQWVSIELIVSSIILLAYRLRRSVAKGQS
ncbi:MAG: prolipoprotein diacylglyceryl transferase [Armatimonadota bacterium]|nr:prolipoprotein diacylglyceryl transferase [Armatimonadota bacterium]